MKYAGVVTDREWINALYLMPELRRKRILEDQESTEKNLNDASYLIRNKMFGNIWAVLNPDKRVYDDELELFNKGEEVWA